MSGVRKSTDPGLSVAERKMLKQLRLGPKLGEIRASAADYAPVPYLVFARLPKE
jgi:hypothetical protein